MKPQHIPCSGNISREKTFTFRYETRILRRKLSRISPAPRSGRLPIVMWAWPQNFAEKTFTDGSATTKNAKVFSLESFPLFGITSKKSQCLEFTKLKPCPHYEPDSMRIQCEFTDPVRIHFQSALIASALSFYEVNWILTNCTYTRATLTDVGDSHMTRQKR